MHDENKMTYIFEEEGWKKAYQKHSNRKIIWIYIKFSNDSTVFLDEYEDWLTVDEYCKKNTLTIKEVGLQYRTNRVTENTSDWSGIYLVRSIKADFGLKPKHCYTVGKVIDDKIEKSTWIVPELTLAFNSVDTIAESFEKAIINNEKKQTKAIQ